MLQVNEMSNRDRQLYEEKTVFREFAKVCPLLEGLTSIEQPDSDPPDILCELATGETLAFELVACEDEIEEGQAHTKVENDKHDLCTALEQEYKKARDEGRIDQPERFESHSVWVYFADDSTLNKRRNAAPQVIEHLNQLGPGCHAIEEPHIRSIRCKPHQHACSCVGPKFYVGPALSIVNAQGVVLSRIKSKIDCMRKKIAECKFKCDGKIHLLVWSTTANDTEFEGFGLDKELAAFLKSNDMEPFERIWVFGYGKKSIVFDSADVAALRDS
jgi:hypothetical protein